MIVQTSLLNQANISQKTINFDNIRATFVNIENNLYDIVLEINSNKFFINMETLADNIERFEIIAVK